MQGSVDLVELVRELAARDATRTEADLQSAIRTLLLYGNLNLDDPEVRLEAQAGGQTRIDVEIGLAAIECKKDLRSGRVREMAVDQLKGYVEARTIELGQRYAGLLTDGAEWELYHWDQASDAMTLVATHSVNPMEPDVARLVTWLEAVLSTGELLVPTPEEVERKLGSTSPGFHLDVAELHDIYAQCRDNPEVRMKRELWARLLAAAAGTNFEDSDDLFIEHTHLVLTAEVIAHALMGIDLSSGSVTPEALVSGEVFRQHDITGVVDPDFFDWPVVLDQGAAFVKSLSRRLSRFAWSKVDHDVLKVLYESVIDRETRHRLGEYYTPDWLAERIVSSVVDDPLEQRVLDPACGSGTFLFWAVRHLLAAADAVGMSNADAITRATSSIFGIDLHPVAVTLARVTYLLAIGTDRLQDRGALHIPVYLGDSIQYAQNTTVLAAGGITIHTTDGLEFFAQTLTFPESVVGDAARFDQLVDELATRASTRKAFTKPPGIKGILDRHGVPPADQPEVEQTFSVLCNLHDNNRNHIWGYYIRNLARPFEFSRSAGRVDRLVGNPPWLRYNAMPAVTQAEFKRLSQERGIWAAAHVVTSQDLAGLFVVRAMELYLKQDGCFGFVMPAAALSRLQYAGFRSGKYTSNQLAVSLGVAFSRAWELSSISPQPFPVPAGVVFGSRANLAAAAPLPTKAEYWKADIGDHHQSWDEVASAVTTSPGTITVGGGELLSPYGSLVRQGANLVPRLLLTVVERPPSSLGVPTGKTAVESDRTAPERPPWRDLPSLQGVVEDNFLFPMLLGESLVPYRIIRSKLAVIPIDDGKLLPEQQSALDAYPGLAEWWQSAASAYDGNKPDTTTHDLVGQINYQSKLVGQFPLAPHRVIYTGRGERVTAARASHTAHVVDHALYWAAFTSSAEAQYVCAVVNSQWLQSRIDDALSTGLFGGRNIHRAPFLVGWPAYDAGNPLHRDIAAAAAKAEATAATVNVSGLSAGAVATARRRIREALASSGVAAEIESLVGQLIEE